MKKGKTMKKIVFIIITFLLILSVFSFNAFAETENGFEYSVIGNQALIQAVDQSVNGDVIIPDTLGGYPVVSILEYAFRESNVKSVALPDTLTFIGEGAFINCEKLEKINIPLGVKEIKKDTFSQCFSLKNIKLSGTVTLIGGNAFFNCVALEKINLSGVTNIEFSAFRNCQKLSSVTLSDSIETIGESAFFGCTSLKEFSIPSSVNYIGYDVFSQCYALTKINVDNNSKYFSSVDGVLYNEAVTELYWYPSGKTSTSFVMPKTVEKVHWGAFAGNKFIKSITVNFIGTERNGEFSTGFVSIFGDKMPSNVETVILKDVVADSGSTFYDCTKIKKIVLPATVTEIGEYAFAGCSSLTSINIPKSVKAIGDGAFKNCTSLKKITFPKGVKEGKDIFEGVANVKVSYKSKTEEKVESQQMSSNITSSETLENIPSENKQDKPSENIQPEKEPKLYKILIVVLLSIMVLALILRTIILIIKKKVPTS